MMNEIGEIKVINDESLSIKEKNAKLYIQLIVDGYLKNHKSTLMKETLLERGLENKPGLIYNIHIAVIQNMLAEEFLLMKLNLQEEIEKNGEKFIFGKFSDYESTIIANKINNLAGILTIIEERNDK